MEGFPDETVITQATAQIDHSHIKKVESVAEIAQVYEVAVCSAEDGVAVLQVTVNGGVGVRGIGYETGYAVFLLCAEEGVLREQAVVAVLDTFELCGIYMYGM